MILVRNIVVLTITVRITNYEYCNLGTKHSMRISYNAEYMYTICYPSLTSYHGFNININIKIMLPIKSWQITFT
jgi:hypothetical protein